MLDKIKAYQPKFVQFLQNFQDVRAIGLVLFVVITLLITWSGVKVIETNYRLQREIAVFEQQNAIRELQNRNTELQNQFYETDEYLDLEARRNFGLAAPGETVYVVPKAAALARVLPAEASEEAAAQEASAPSNFSLWIDFLFGRSS